MRTGRGLIPQVVDLGTRTFWRLTGRPVDLDGTHAWLAGPTSVTSDVGDAWVRAEASRLGAAVRAPSPDAGLLADMSLLDGPGFSAADLHPTVRDFYEHTSRWRMEAVARWSPLFWPAGALVTGFFGRRVQQLALPTRRSDASGGIDSIITTVVDDDASQLFAAWLRRLRATGDVVFSGSYSPRTLPGADRRSVHAVFPLESGNVQVFLHPRVDAGALVLDSPAGTFGDDGAYVVVAQRGRSYAARVPLHETFRVHVDADGVLRAEHVLRLWRARIVRLDYRMAPVDDAATSPTATATA